MTLQTPRSLLAQAKASYSCRPAFKLPTLAGPDTDEVAEWTTISYAQFTSDVDRYAKYWTAVLSRDGIEPRSTVAMWLGGIAYEDILHIYGMLTAGYIPQLFSLRLPNPDVVSELLHKAGAKALVYDVSYESAVHAFSVPAHRAAIDESFNAEDAILCNSSEPVGSDIAMIFHTSGSTSGSPKLVRCTYKWLDAIISKAHKTCVPKDQVRQDAMVWMGSMCHIAQNFMLIGSLLYGSCTIQPTKIAFSSNELLDMTARCGLNRLKQFSTFLGTHLRHSRNDPKLLAALQNLDEVLYSGLMLGQEEAAWAYQNGIKLTNMFGNTECGAMLLSIGGTGNDAKFLRAVEGTAYGFLPIDSSNTVEDEHINANAQLLELVVLSESGDCPDPSLRAVDGHYHTGDLFQEVAPESYIFRGRDDDWIKSENSLRCDTKAIEDNVRATCADLVSECIVVGNGRPSPALFVESQAGLADQALKKAILRRIRHFHSRRYLHERIALADFIFVVAPGTLPRTATKGNIRRRAVEEAFKRELDVAYGVSD